MKLHNPFKRKPTVSDAARAMARQGVERREAKRRAMVNQMRANAGLPAWEWRT